jgi:hypothetical protein
MIEDGKKGFIREGGILRKCAELSSKLTDSSSSTMLLLTEVNLLRQDAYRWLSDRIGK